MDKLDIIKNILGPKPGQKNHASSRKVARQVNRHVWSIADEQLVIDLYKRKASKDEIKTAIVETELKLNSVLAKLSNIKFLDTGIGLANVSETTRILWTKQ